MSYICKSCGAALKFEGNASVATCRYCGSRQALPKTVEDEKIQVAYNLIRSGNFSEAKEVCSEIIKIKQDHHEAYWARALAKNGVIFVDDIGNKKVPTCQNIVETSFVNDADVQNAIKYAPEDFAENYKSQSNKIEKIRKEWFGIASKEKPCDVFICFKDSDRENGIERTKDSYYAQDLYEYLTKKGFNVFFSRVSLMDKVSEHYEPYIYNALKTAKVMIVYGEKAEYFEATWLKNEWSRFITRMQRENMPSKSLIVAHKGVDPYQMPDELVGGRQIIDLSSPTGLMALFETVEQTVKSYQKPKTQPVTPPPQPKVEKQPEPAPRINKNISYDKPKKKSKAGLIIALIVVFIGIVATIGIINDRSGQPNNPNIDIPGGSIIFDGENVYWETTVTEGEYYPMETDPYENPTEDVIDPEIEASGAGIYQDGELVYSWEQMVSDGVIYVYGNVINSSNNSYGGHLVIPEGIEEIASDAFAWAGYHSIALPSTLKTIGTTAFRGSSLNEIEIPASVEMIGESAFDGCGFLEKVILNEGLQAIDVRAFANCGALKEIKLPEGLQTISNGAFTNCTSISEIVIPNTVTLIENEAFAYCTSLEAIVISNSITTIPPRMLCGCSALEFVDIPEGVVSIEREAFAECNGIIGISLPNSLTSVGEHAFQSCHGIKNIIFPEQMTYFGSNLFNGCDMSLISVFCKGNQPADYNYNALGDCSIIWNWENNYDTAGLYKDGTMVSTWDELVANGYIVVEDNKIISVLETLEGRLVVHSNVRAIGEKAFKDCVSLTAINLPTSVFEIGNRAFVGCTGLTEMTIPSNVQTFGLQIFKDATNIKTVYYNSNYSGGNENSIFAQTNVEKVVFGGTAVPEYVLANCNQIKEIVLCEGITEIRGYAFQKCSITSITLPSTLNSVYGQAFADCNKLREVHTKDIESWLNIYFDDNPLMYAKNLYVGGELLTHLVIPNTVTEIKSRAFNGCQSIVSVLVPDSVKTISYDAFSGCSRLVEVINDSYLDIVKGDSTYGCISYYALTVHEGDSVIDNIDGFMFIKDENENNLLIGYTGDKTDITLPESYNGEGYIIRQHAFNELNNLISVVIPNTVIKIEGEAFYNCNKLESISLPYVGMTPDTLNSNGRLNIIYCQREKQEGGVEVPDNAWYFPSSLKSITITGGQSIPSESFRDCIYLESIIIESEELTRIESCAFAGCSALKNVVLPSSLKFIGQAAFENCVSIEDIQLPEGLETIEHQAFMGNTSLKSFTIPNSVTSVSTQVLQGCEKLEFLSTPLYPGCLIRSLFTSPEYAPSLRTVVITEVKTNSNGVSSEFMKDFSGITSITLPQGLSDIGESAFENCTGLTSIVLPDSVTNVGVEAFKGCSNLKEINLPKGLIYISTEAFANCTSLSEISIPSSVTNIGTSAFQYCSELASVKIAEGVSAINMCAFSGCVKLTSIVIPMSVTNMASEIFYECSPSLVINCVTPAIPQNWDGWWNDGFNNETNEAFDYVVNWGYQESGRMYGLYESGTNNLLYSWTDLINNGYISVSNLYEVGLTIASSNCDILSGDLVIAEGIKNIANGAFEGCAGLTSIVLPQSLRQMDQYAINSCPSLAKIYIPQGDSILVWNQFAQCGNPDLTIYCEATERSENWDEQWNKYSDNQYNQYCYDVVWGYVFGESTEEPTDDPAEETTDSSEETTDDGIIDVGETIFFGSFEQDNNTSNGQEDIEWIVLEKTENSMLVISKYSLDNRAYDDTASSRVTWESSTIRSWLNNDFVNTAFTEGEQARIMNVTLSAGSEYETVNKVFLLDHNEAHNYFPTADGRACFATPYAGNNETFNSVIMPWILRLDETEYGGISYVDEYGTVYVNDNDAYTYGGIRPAMWIEIV